MIAERWTGGGGGETSQIQPLYLRSKEFGLSYISGSRVVLALP